MASLIARRAFTAMRTTPSMHLCRRTFAVQAGQRRFTKDHEYILVTGPNKGTVGITDHAQSELGDIVHIDLPDVGAKFAQKESFGSVESVKAASSVYAPVDIKVVETNSKLIKDSALLNQSAEKDGWMIKVEFSNPAQLDALLDEAAYKKHVADSKH